VSVRAGSKTITRASAAEVLCEVWGNVLNEAASERLDRLYDDALRIYLPNYPYGLSRPFDSLLAADGGEIVRRGGGCSAAAES
jgi:hypothetical protein